MSNDLFENRSTWTLTAQQMYIHVTEHAIAISQDSAPNATRWFLQRSTEGSSLWNYADALHNPPAASFEYERPRRARAAVTDYRRTVRMFVTVLHRGLCPGLVFNIRIMLSICYLAIWSRGVNCPQLWRENTADIDFKSERFFLQSSRECYVWGKESEDHF